PGCRYTYLTRQIQRFKKPDTTRTSIRSSTATILCCLPLQSRYLLPNTHYQQPDQMKSNSLFILLLTFVILNCRATAQPGSGTAQLNNRQQKQYEQIKSANNRGALEEALEGLNKLLA